MFNEIRKMMTMKYSTEDEILEEYYTSAKGRKNEFMKNVYGSETAEDVHVQRGIFEEGMKDLTATYKDRIVSALDSGAISREKMAKALDFIDSYHTKTAEVVSNVMRDEWA